MAWILGLVGLCLGPAGVSFGLGAGGGGITPLTPGGAGFFASQPKMLPQWVADQQGIAFEPSFGLLKDQAQALLKEAVKARWPDPWRGDALPLQGRDRRIYRAPVETDAQYAARLNTAGDLWQWAGTPTAMVGIFAPYGYSSTSTTGSRVTVVPNYAVILEGNLTWFSRFIILVGPSYWSSDGLWSSPGNYNDGGVWDSTAQIADLDFLRASIREMKAPGSYPVLIGVQLADIAGDGLWDSPPDAYDAAGATWSTAGSSDVTYWLLGEFWGQDAYFGGTDLWQPSGDVWGDFVPPVNGGFTLRN